MGIKTFGDVGGGDPQISKYFTLSQLTVTSQNANNSPNESELANLKKLGTVLDMLTDSIGPFTVLSAFRSADVEAALTASGQPTAEAAAGHTSFHTVGLGADIYPTTMTLDEYFGKMLAAIGTDSNPGPLRDQMTEVAYKPTQGSIHLAAAVDYRANNVILALNDAGTYAKLTADEIINYASPYLQQAITAVADVVSSPVGATSILALGLGAVMLYFMLAKPAKRLA